jgi:hypothetical protein
MRLIEKLMAKRDAAFAEYQKWSTMIDTLQQDPEFASITHHGATKVMQQAHALANGNGNGDGNGSGHGPGKGRQGMAAFPPEQRAAIARKGWTPERRARYSAMLKVRNPMHEATKAKRKLKGTPESRAAAADRLRKRLSDPKFTARRLAALRKALKAKMKAKKAGKPWVAKNAERIQRQREQAATS